jgi:hypothetical protein
LPEIYEYRPGKVENERTDVFFWRFCQYVNTFFRVFFLETVQKLIFVAISHVWDLFYHEEKIRAVIFIDSKDLGKFQKK